MRHLFLHSALGMARIQAFVFAASTAFWCGLAFSQSAEAGSYVAEEKAIHEACPEREAFGNRIPVGSRLDPQYGSITRCKSAAEGRAAVAEEKAIHEACPEREAFGNRISAGHRLNQYGSITKCKSAAEGRAAVAEEKAIHEACPEREAFGNRIPVGSRLDPQYGSITRCKSAAEGRAAVAEEKAIHEACPEREAFGNRVPAGHRLNQYGSITKCGSAAEGRAAVAEEKAIHEACPEREAFGNRIPAGHRLNQYGSITRCKSVAEGESESVVAEKKLPQVSGKQAISETQPVSGGGGQAQPSAPPTYQDVLTAQELAWSNSLPYAHRATTQFSPAQIVQIKQDGRWEPWVALTKAEVSDQKKTNQKPVGTSPTQSHQDAAPALNTRSLQTRIEVNERIISDLPAGGMRQAAVEKLTQAKREFQAGRLEASQTLLHEAIEYALLAGNLERDKANLDDVYDHPKNIVLFPIRSGKNIISWAWPKELPRYGNFGGLGYTGGYDGNQLPINRMDELFQKHDRDYRNANNNDDAILRADRELIAGLEKINENNIQLFMNGSKGRLYGSLEEDLEYLKKAKKLFSKKIGAQEAFKGGTVPIGLGGGR